MKRHKQLREERQHMETLLNQRFYLFIIILGFLVLRLLNADSLKEFRAIIISGFIIELLLTLLIGRANRRLQINMKLLKKIGDVSHEIKKKAARGCCVNPFNISAITYMGYLIPIVITFILFMLIIASSEVFDHINPGAL